VQSNWSFICRLKGFFSQIDHRLKQHLHELTSVVKEFTAILPPQATNVYYKDLVGNVTTSRFRSEKKRSVLELRPRYPLFGGWKFTWWHGYSIPQSPYLRLVGENDQYEIKLSMLPSIKHLCAENAALKLILPEGATFEVSNVGIYKLKHHLM
jgi:oligosaccharyltransferase complex subunit alpha (ribophorin I)